MERISPSVARTMSQSTPHVCRASSSSHASAWLPSTAKRKNLDEFAIVVFFTISPDRAHWGSMNNHDLTKDPLWADYEHASESLKRLMRAREDIEADLVRRFSMDALAAWNDAHHEEERTNEEVK